jgi:16S rRNA (uracil1498-N3)-methyltransferase
MHRFFLTGVALQPGSPIDLSPLAHQLHHVLRLTAGRQIILLNDKGGEYVVQLTAVGQRQAAGVALNERPVQGEPTFHLTLYLCSLKSDKFEWVLQKGTELGVSEFTPVISQRSVVRPAAVLLKKYDRWREILREAAEQSGRGRIPLLNAPLEWRDAVQSASGVRLIAWEEQPAACAIEFAPENAHLPMSLAVGPEGGLTEDEVSLARSIGWQAFSLGRRTLRAETAALAATAALMARYGELGDLSLNV